MQINAHFFNGRINFAKSRVFHNITHSIRQIDHLYPSISNKFKKIGLLTSSLELEKNRQLIPHLLDEIRIDLAKYDSHLRSIRSDLPNLPVVFKVESLKENLIQDFKIREKGYTLLCEMYEIVKGFARSGSISQDEMTRLTELVSNLKALAPEAKIQILTLKPNKFVGCLLGAAIGDALGMPVEFMTRDQIKNEYGSVIDFYEKPNRRLKAGMWTDDTALTLATLESVLENKGINPKDLASKLGRIFQIERYRGYGRATKTALKRISKGYSWKESGTEGMEALGSGATMRISPVALFSALNLEELKRNCVMASQITHKHPEAISGSLAVGFIISRAITESLNLKTILNEVREFIGPSQLAGRLVKVQRLLEGKVEISEALKKLGLSGSTLETVPSALYIFLRMPKDFEQALIAAVSAGGDADTRATILGAISGAYNGIESIPVRWRDKVEKSLEITELALKLFELVRSRAHQP